MFCIIGVRLERKKGGKMEWYNERKRKGGKKGNSEL